MQVVFATETLTRERFDEAFPLLVEHWREVAHFQDIPLEPDFAAYEGAAAAGMVRFFTARGPVIPSVHSASSPRPGMAQMLIGYALFFVRPNPHYASSVQANQDVVYLAPRARGLGGWKFLKWCDEQLRAEGVEVVYHHIKALHDFGPMLNRMGYELVDQIYARRLNGRDSSAGGNLRILGDQPESDESEGEGRCGETAEDAGRRLREPAEVGAVRAG